jgi:signal peptidase I
MNVIRRISAIVSVVVLIVVAGLAFLLHHPTYGFSAHVVLSGSMVPTLAVGDVTIERRLIPLAYKPGDVVTFTLLDGQRTTVTHRIVRRVRLASGAEAVETKGDANTDGDPWTVSLGQIEGKKMLRIPFIGYALRYVKTPSGFLAISATLFFVFVMFELYFLLGMFQALVLRLRSLLGLSDPTNNAL